jgi:hypothetical protein
MWEKVMLKKAIVLGSAFLLLCGISGCSSDSHDKLIQEMIDVLDDASSAMAKIKDQKTAKENMDAVAAALKKDGKKLKSLTARSEAIGEHLDPDEKARLDKEYQAKFKEAYQRASKEWNRIKNIKRVEKELRQKGALKDFGFTK